MITISWSKLYEIAYAEKPISSAKYNAEIDNIYDKLNGLKINFASSSAPSDIEIGQTWFDTSTGELKIYTSSGYQTIAYISNLTESNVKDDSNPVFLTIDGSRQLSASYIPSNDQDIATKKYVDDNAITPLSNHTSDTTNPHQVKESQVRDDTNKVFLTIDGTRSLDSTYTPTNPTDIATKDYVDNHIPDLTESNVRDDSNPVFLTIDGTRQLSPTYTPSNDQDIATKSYVDTQVATGGAGSISALYVSYEPDSTSASLPSSWASLSNAQEALDYTHQWLISLSNSSPEPENLGKVLLSSIDASYGYLLEKLDSNIFVSLTASIATIKDKGITASKISSEGQPSGLALVSDGSGGASWSSISTTDELVKASSTDPTAGYLTDKLDSTYFENQVSIITIKDTSITKEKLSSTGASSEGDIYIADGSGGIEFAQVDNSTLEFDTVYKTFKVKYGGIVDNHIASTANIAWTKIDKTNSALNDLGDVSIDTPANNQVIAYNATAGKWVNQDAPSGVGLDVSYLTLFLR